MAVPAGSRVGVACRFRLYNESIFPLRIRILADTEEPDSGAPDSTDIRPVSITDEMKRSYLDYAMSVIVARALPDARDGLKPVHRRILFGMYENGFEWNKPYRKSARTVGDVIGKYHPHGDQSVYDALVRMAQDFSMRVPLIDGQGNFGSVDGDMPAAMRYTESRLTKVAQSLLDDIDKDTVDFQPNYDSSEKEPRVLPAKFPNLLVNGAGGIAVGMATNIPPHNLGECIDACIALIDDPALGLDDLIKIIPGPDFPTGGIILGRQGIRGAYHLGRGSIVMRGKVSIEEIRKDRQAIVVTEIPYQVNKAGMVERIAELVREKKIEGIGDLRDESDRDGYRVVVELKRDAVPEVVLNQLYKFTPLQTNFGANIVALDGGRPQVMNLKDLLTVFIAFRENVVSRRTKFLLNKARDRAHILVGLAIAVANIDEVIKVIRTSPDPNTARDTLMSREWPAKDVAAMISLIDDPRHRMTDKGTARLSMEQAKAILDLRLQRLTALGRDEIKEELDKLAVEIADYLEILRSRARIQGIIKDELNAVKEEFATPRRTVIIDQEGEVEDEDLIQREDMVVTVSHAGYVKRVPLSAYRAQKRGGKGRSGMATREEDFVSRLFIASTHTPVLFFSSRGQVYKEKVWRLPMAAPNARGKAMINILPLEQGERITTIMPLPEDEKSWGELDIIFATTGGTVRRNKLSDFVDVRRSGIIAMKLADDESIVDVQIAKESDDVLLTAAGGQCIRFPVNDVRVFTGRTSMGVRGIALGKGDRLISLTILHHLDASSEERAAYLKMRRAVAGETAEEAADADAEETSATVQLNQARYAQMSAAEQFVLTISANGYGKRSSSYEYRTTGRGGKGIVAMAVNNRNGKLVASFPVDESDQIMLVTDAGQLIRCPVEGIRVAGRSTQGVIVFDTADDEKVVSVEHITDEAENGNGG
ncbi:MAG: DNA gyrase subunit A [Rhizobiales bacterium]|nr:DNA gyrase subunit A [Hyphomicrobiales bacterium]